MANNNDDMPAAQRRHQTGRRGDALLIIDCINDLEFPGGEKVLPWALKLSSRLKDFRAGGRRTTCLSFTSTTITVTGTATSRTFTTIAPGRPPEAAG